jgi:enterobactin synthetase component F
MSRLEPMLTWYPLTFAQLDFWEEFRAHPGVAVSTVAHVTRFEGKVDVAALARAIRQTVAESDVLALRFRETADGPTQTVDRCRMPLLQQIDLRSCPDPQTEARRMMDADIAKPMDLTRDLLSAQWLMRTADATWLWYCRGHHIFLDGYAMALIERRVARIYAHLTRDSDAGQPLAPFAAYLEEEAAYRAGPQHLTAAAFWRDAIAAGPDLPVLTKGSEDYPAKPLCAEIDLSDLSHPLGRAAAALQIGEADLLTLLAGIWLCRHPCGPNQPEATDRVIWLPYMSRFGSVSANIPAMVVNIFPFRVALNRGASLRENLVAAAGSLRRHRRHGRYRIEQMAQDCGLSSRQRFLFSPLVNVMPFDMAEYPGLRTEREVLAAGPADGFNMTFACDSRSADLILWLEADPVLTSPELFDFHRQRFPAFLRDSVTSFSQAGPEALRAAS